MGEIQSYGPDRLDPAQGGPLDLGSLLDKAGAQANRVLSRVVDVIQPVLLADGGDDVRYVADMPEKMRRALKNGDLKFDRDKQGRPYAQLRVNGKYGKKFPIKEEAVEGVDPAQVAVAAQMAAVKEQLESIARTLNDIGEEVSLVAEGQRTDREALCESGESLMLQAVAATDHGFKRLLMAQAVKSLSDGKAQMEKDFQTHVRALEAGFDGKGGKTRVQKIGETMDLLHRDFSGIHQATALMVAAYFQVGETGAMLEAVRSYGRFIEGAVVPNQALIADYDIKDTKLVGGVWETRAKALSDIQSVGGRALPADCVMGLLEEGDDEDGE